MIDGMGRPRKSRLIPSITLFVEELVRHLGERVDRAVAGSTALLRDELGQLKRELVRLRAERAAAPAGRTGRPRTVRVCSVRGCDQPHVARGLCKKHYQRLRYAERKPAAG
jgi:hypothetical protein